MAGSMAFSGDVPWWLIALRGSDPDVGFGS